MQLILPNNAIRNYWRLPGQPYHCSGHVRGFNRQRGGARTVRRCLDMFVFKLAVTILYIVLDSYSNLKFWPIILCKICNEKVPNPHTNHHLGENKILLLYYKIIEKKFKECYFYNLIVEQPIQPPPLSPNDY